MHRFILFCASTALFGALTGGVCRGASGGGTVGSAVCAQCHKAIAASQSRTHMALTWHGAASALLPAGYEQRISEGPDPAVEYRIGRVQDRFEYRVKLPGREGVKLAVETIVGGARHGLSFLVRLPELGGLKLARAPLIETRYLAAVHERALALSPGFPAETPNSYETALGRVLPPGFERKCLVCHGQPGSEARGRGGVGCEDCHGEGQAHLQAVARGVPRSGIVNPASLRGSEAMQRCAQCHSGFSEISDPLPDDLLISNQVNALQNSECFIQSGEALTCANCHDPHRDDLDVAAKSVAACLSCHNGRTGPRAAVCPTGRKDGCLACHMPTVEKGSFKMVDHWIRAPGEPAPPRISGVRTQVRPKREFLRIIVMDDAARAAAVHARLEKGESFFALAGENSSDASAPGGGYIGEMWLDRMDPKLADAAARLGCGEFSDIVAAPPRYVILGRMPRDFRWRAARLEREASALKAAGQVTAAVDKYQEALRVYPHFLRALIFLGASVGELGNGERAAGILQLAAQLYPKDPAAQYNLGIAYGSLGRGAEEMQAYRKALDLEPDLLPAYQNLGAALAAAGQLEAAADAYRRGLEQNPLSAILYYNLAVIREQQGDAADARRAMDLALKIDPAFVERQRQGVR